MWHKVPWVTVEVTSISPHGPHRYLAPWPRLPLSPSPALGLVAPYPPTHSWWPFPRPWRASLELRKYISIVGYSAYLSRDIDFSISLWYNVRMGQPRHQFGSLYNPDPADFQARCIILDAELLDTDSAHAQQVEIELIKLWRIANHPALSSLLLKDDE